MTHGWDPDELSGIFVAARRPERAVLALDILDFLSNFDGASQPELALLRRGRIGPDARRSMGVRYWRYAQNDQLKPEYAGIVSTVLQEKAGRLVVNMAAFLGQLEPQVPRPD